MNPTKVITTGVVATAVMSVVAIMAPMMGMPKMDFGVMLGVNNPMMPMPYAAGWMIHFVIGIVLTAIYASVFLNRLIGSYVVRGIVFAMLPFVIAQSMMMPMMGNGFWSGGDVMAIMGSLIGHVCFGAVLGSVYGKGE